MVFSTNRFTKRKTIVITEDLNEQPTEKDIKKYNKSVVMRSKKATELLSLTVRELDARAGIVPVVTLSNFGGNLTSTMGALN